MEEESEMSDSSLFRRLLNDPDVPSDDRCDVCGCLISGGSVAYSGFEVCEECLDEIREEER